MDLQVQYMPVQVLAHSGHSLSLGQPAAGEVSDLQMTDQPTTRTQRLFVVY